MPELPDLENFVKNLKVLLNGKKLLGLTAYDEKSVAGDLLAAQNVVRNAEVADIIRNGKELYFVINGMKISVHLMLNGTMFFFETVRASNVKYKLFSLNFNSGDSLFVTDFQGIAKIKLFAEPDYLTPDALSSEFTLEYLTEKLASSKRTIKGMLVDQKVVKGIGNAYADEILWAAKIDPESTAKKIPKDAVAYLYEKIHSVLLSAVETLKRVRPNSISGEEREFLSVHNPILKTTGTGYPILTKTVASKQTYFTAEQILYV